MATEAIKAETEACARCGKKFAKRQYSQRFCSSGCRNGYHNDRMRELIELGKAARGVTAPGG